MHRLHTLATAIVFASAHYAFAAVLFASAYGAGRRLLSRLRFANAAEELACSVGLGVGLFAQSIFLLGLIHQIHGPIAGALLLAGLAFGRHELTDGLRRSLAYIRNSSLAARMWMLVALAAATGLAIVPLYPPHVWDAMSYHLPSSRLYATQGAVRPTPYLIFCAFTQLNEMLFTASMLFSDAIAAQCIQYGLLLVVAVAIGGAARRFGVRSSWTVAALIGIPLVVRLSGTAYIDIGLMFFVTLLLLSFDEWWKSREPAWLVAAGMFAGFAASTKYTANVFILAAAILVVVHVYRTKAWKDLLRFALPLAVLAAPWYLYIFATTGNPVFPFLTNVFGTGCWSAEDVAVVHREFSSLGTPRTLQSLVRLPWNLVFHQEKFLLEGPLSPIVFGGLPLWIGAGLVAKRTRLLSGLALLYTLFWFFTAQAPRYLSPVFPLLCLFLALTFGWIADRLPSILRFALVPLVIAALLIPTVRYLIAFAPIGRPPITAAQRDAFVERYDTYPCYRWLNDHYGSNYTVYAFDQPFMRFFARGTRIGDVIGTGRYGDLRYSDGRELQRRLREYGAEFVLFASDKTMTVAPPNDPWFKTQFVLSCACGTGTLWRASPYPVRATFGVNLIDDGGFEKLDGTHWVVGTSALVDKSGKESYAGQNAVRVNPLTIALSQELPLVPSRRYQLSFHTRGSVPTNARVVMSWFDERHIAIRDEVHDVPVGSSWGPVSMVLFSPPRTATATMYLESIEAPLWYDDVALRLMLYEPAEAAQRRTTTVLSVFRAAGHRIFARHSVSAGFADEVVPVSGSGIPVSGDWDGDGNVDFALYDAKNGSFDVRYAGVDRVIRTERGGLPVSGDWNGDGRWTIGVFYPADASFVLYEDDRPAARFQYGEPNDLPVAGDWDGDGRMTIGTYRPSTATFELRNRNDSGPADQSIRFGSGHEIPVSGDWNASGTTSVGLFDPKDAVFQLRNSDGTQLTVPFGIAGDYGFAATVRVKR